MFQDKLAEKLGWEFGEDEQFKSVSELVDYMEEVVKEASKPDFANEDIEKLNEFVKDGGKLEDYFKAGPTTELDLNTLDLEVESNQKAVIKEFLKTKGYKDDRIQKIVDRYEDSDLLKEESEDAVELLKEYREEKREKLLEETKKQREALLEQQQNFIKSVEDSIKGTDIIRGYKLTPKQKQELKDYILKVDSDGLTKFQKTFTSDVKNLIESAFIIKEGDAFLKQTKQSATSDAYKKLHQKLKVSKGKRLSGSVGQEESGDSDVLSTIGKTLLKKI